MIPGFSWVHRDKLAGMADPRSVPGMSLNDVFDRLVEMNVRVIVSLTEHPLPEDIAELSGIDCVHMPIADMHAPTQDMLRIFLEIVRQTNAADRGVAVHCRAGLGRTGTMLAAYLISQGHTVTDAIALLRKVRPGSVETASQYETLMTYANTGSQ